MINWHVEGVGLIMRRRLRKFLPIVLVALTVQIFAPIAACWAASIAASDPLSAAPICSGGMAADTAGHAGESGNHRAHDGACSICCVAHASASADTPQTAVLAPYRHPERVVWLERAPDRFDCRTGSHAQARAPPLLT
jgi:hypothetical protein